MGLFGALAVAGSMLVTFAVGQPETDRAAAERILADIAAGSTSPVPGSENSDLTGDGGILVRPSDGAIVPARAPAVDGGSMVAPAAVPSAGPAREPIETAKRALERADGARRAGDVPHADLLEGLAREWAETARDLLRAVAAESEASQLETGAAQAALRAERQRALLEEAIARRGRAEAELLRFSPDGGAPSSRPPSPPAKPKSAPKGAR